MESFIGTIMPVAFGFAPQGWAICDGSVLSISQNTALFSLIGTNYGGDGVTTFALPDLRGRVAVGQGAGPGLAAVELGQKAGANNGAMNATGNVAISLSAANLPSHTHGASFTAGAAQPVTVTANVSTADATISKASAGVYLGSAKGAGITASPSIYSTAGPTVALNAATVTASGGGISGGSVTVEAAGAGEAFVAPVSLNGQVPVMQPFLGMNYIICMQGIFPSRQ